MLLLERYGYFALSLLTEMDFDLGDVVQCRCGTGEHVAAIRGSQVSDDGCYHCTSGLMANVRCGGCGGSARAVEAGYAPLTFPPLL